MMMIPRPIRCFLLYASAMVVGGSALADTTLPPAPERLMGHRFLTLNTIVRVHQIEVSREVSHGPDESSVHRPEDARTFREAIETASSRNFLCPHLQFAAT